MKKSTTNEYATFWIEEGILYFIYHPGTILNLRVAEKVVADRLKFQQDITYPVFCNAQGVKDTEKAARDFLAREGSFLVRAVAYLVNPPISHAITDFFLRANRPTIPAEIFTEKFEALSFLKPYTKK